MKRTTTTTMALVATLALIGIGSMPVQAAVDPDCDADDPIEPSQPLQTRTLQGNDAETLDIKVGAQEEITVRVELWTDDVFMEWGLFYLDGTTCKVAIDDLDVNCDDDEVLDTRSLEIFPPEDQECDLEAPQSGTIEYFFRFENPQGSSIEYKAFVV